MKNVLATAAEVVVFLFAAFGGHLVAAAPPISAAGGVPARFAVGLASFAALLVFLLVKAWMGGWPGRTAWAVAAPALALAYVASAFAYQRSFSENTFGFRHSDTETTTEIRGHELTKAGEDARAWFVANKGREPLAAELVRDEAKGVDGIPVLWTTDSLREAYDELLRLYVAMIVCLAAAIACLIELVAVRPPARSGGAVAAVGTPHGEGATPAAA